MCMCASLMLLRQCMHACDNPSSCQFIMLLQVNCLWLPPTLALWANRFEKQPFCRCCCCAQRTPKVWFLSLSPLSVTIIPHTHAHAHMRTCALSLSLTHTFMRSYIKLLSVDFRLSFHPNNKRKSACGCSHSCLYVTLMRVLTCYVHVCCRNNKIIIIG